jgi:hypothetical protein
MSFTQEQLSEAFETYSLSLLGKTPAESAAEICAYMENPAESGGWKLTVIE